MTKKKPPPKRGLSGLGEAPRPEENRRRQSTPSTRTKASPVTQKPFTWSYSSLQAFETCPWRWKLTKLDKVVSEPQTEATLHGNRVHKILELSIKGTQGLPQSYAYLQPIVSRIRASKVAVETERKVALRADFRETTYFAKDVWYRGVFDVRVPEPGKTVVLDWKTGKRKTDTDQLRLFAATEFAINPHVEIVETGYVWLQERKVDKETFSRKDSPDLWGDFLGRVQRIEHAIKTDSFPKKPSGLCRNYCPVGKARCEYCGE